MIDTAGWLLQASDEWDFNLKNLKKLYMIQVAADTRLIDSEKNPLAVNLLIDIKQMVSYIRDRIKSNQWDNESRECILKNLRM